MFKKTHNNNLLILNLFFFPSFFLSFHFSSLFSLPQNFQTKHAPNIMLYNKSKLIKVFIKYDVYVNHSYGNNQIFYSLKLPR